MSDNDSVGIRPVVRTAGQSKLGPYVFGVILLAGGIGLYSALSAGREAANAPVTTIPGSDASRISSPPPLVLPEWYAERQAPTRRQFARNPPPNTPVMLQQVPSNSPAPAYTPPAPLPQQVSPTFPVQDVGPRTIFNQPRTAPTAPNIANAEPAEDERVAAGRLASPSMTVPQGTVIPAVLETAFDSTREGSARALVQRDIHGFDGSRVLIPRGSRLYGTYDAGLNLGQSRAQIRWTRLLRPDGVTIALDSPASDPLGRAGVEGDVDSHFFARFGGAILQSVLDLGVGAATRSVSDGVIVALPGSTQNVASTQSQNVQPVLRVEQGTSVSVFVARDLDFSSVER